MILINWHNCELDIFEAVLINTDDLKMNRSWVCIFDIQVYFVIFFFQIIVLKRQHCLFPQSLY